MTSFTYTVSGVARRFDMCMVIIYGIDTVAGQVGGSFGATLTSGDGAIEGINDGAFGAPLTVSP